MNTYKVLLVGDTKVGKTSFARRAMGFDIEEHKITIGVEVHPVRMSRNIYNIWDCAGDDRYGGLRDGYYIGADAAFVFFDWSKESTLHPTKDYINDIKRVSPNCKIILIGNKHDIKGFRNKLEWAKRYTIVNISCLDGTDTNKAFDAIHE